MGLIGGGSFGVLLNFLAKRTFLCQGVNKKPKSTMKIELSQKMPNFLNFEKCEENIFILSYTMFFFEVTCPRGLCTVQQLGCEVMGTLGHLLPNKGVEVHLDAVDVVLRSMVGVVFLCCPLGFH